MWFLSFLKASSWILQKSMKMFCHALGAHQLKQYTQHVHIHLAARFTMDIEEFNALRSMVWLHLGYQIQIR